jgi:hypothetical protein
MLSSLLYLVAKPAGDSPALCISALADVPADAAVLLVTALLLLLLPLPLLLPKPLVCWFFTVFAAADVSALSDVFDDAAV